MTIGWGLVPLAFVMWAVTYPSRALPLLAPGVERLPGWMVTYLRLAGPAALAALAAVNSLLTTGSSPGAGPRLLIGIVPAAVALCVLVVGRTRLLLPGVAAAVVVVALARATGIAA